MSNPPRTSHDAKGARGSLAGAETAVGANPPAGGTPLLEQGSWTRVVSPRAARHQRRQRALSEERAAAWRGRQATKRLPEVTTTGPRSPAPGSNGGPLPTRRQTEQGASSSGGESSDTDRGCLSCPDGGQSTDTARRRPNGLVGGRLSSADRQHVSWPDRGQLSGSGGPLSACLDRGNQCDSNRPCLSCPDWGHLSCRGHLSCPDGGRMSCPDRGHLSCPDRGHLSCPDRGHPSCPYRGHGSCPDRGHPSCPDRGHPSCPDRGHLSCPDRGHLSCPDRGHLSCPDRGHLSCPDRGHPSCPDRGHLSCPDRGHLSCPDRGHPSCPYRGHRSCPDRGHLSCPDGGHLRCPDRGHLSCPDRGHLSCPDGGHLSCPDRGHLSCPDGGHPSCPDGGHLSCPDGGHRSGPDCGHVPTSDRQRSCRSDERPPDYLRPAESDSCSSSDSRSCSTVVPGVRESVVRMMRGGGQDFNSSSDQSSISSHGSRHPGEQTTQGPRRQAAAPTGNQAGSSARVAQPNHSAGLIAEGARTWSTTTPANRPAGAGCQTLPAGWREIPSPNEAWGHSADHGPESSSTRTAPRPGAGRSQARAYHSALPDEAGTQTDYRQSFGTLPPLPPRTDSTWPTVIIDMESPSGPPTYPTGQNSTLLLEKASHFLCSNEHFIYLNIYFESDITNLARHDLVPSDEPLPICIKISVKPIIQAEPIIVIDLLYSVKTMSIYY